MEPDATAASYFAALPLVVGGSLRLDGLRPAGESLQGDVRFLDVLARCGAKVVSGAGNGESRSRSRPRRRHAGPTDDFSELLGHVPHAGGPRPVARRARRGSRASPTRASRRPTASPRWPGNSGASARRSIETDDSLEIHPRPLEGRSPIETHGDHRFAMSFAILGCHDLHGDGSPWLCDRESRLQREDLPGVLRCPASRPTKSSEA